MEDEATVMKAARDAMNQEKTGSVKNWRPILRIWHNFPRKKVK